MWCLVLVWRYQARSSTKGNDFAVWGWVFTPCNIFLLFIEFCFSSSLSGLFRTSTISSGNREDEESERKPPGFIKLVIKALSGSRFKTPEASGRNSPATENLGAEQTHREIARNRSPDELNRSPMRGVTMERVETHQWMATNRH
jgi:hypothetical protein